MYSYAMTTNAVMLLAWRDRLAMICALPDSLSGSDVVDFGWRFPQTEIFTDNTTQRGYVGQPDTIDFSH